MALKCPYCHKRIRIPESETDVLLFPCPNCGGSIDLARVEGDDDSGVVYLSDRDLIEPQEVEGEATARTWADQYPTPRQESRHLHLFRWFAVLLGLVMLIPFIGGYFFLKTTSNKDQVITCLNSYFSEVDDRNYRDAFRKYMASDLQRKKSLEGYLREMEGLGRKLGKIKRRNLMRWTYQSMNRAKSCTLNYSSLYERGNAKEQYTLVKEKDGWKIFDYRIAPYPAEAERGKVQI